MDRFIKSMKAFPFKGMLVIWGIFMLMGAVLFAERSGIHYEGSKSQSAYLSENQIVTEKEAVKELKKYAEEIANLDYRMLKLRNKIEKIGYKEMN